MSDGVMDVWQECKDIRAIIAKHIGDMATHVLNNRRDIQRLQQQLEETMREKTCYCGGDVTGHNWGVLRCKNEVRVLTPDGSPDLEARVAILEQQLKEMSNEQE